MKNLLKFIFIISFLVMFSSANFALSFVDCDIYPNDPICILDPFNPAVDCNQYPDDPVCTYDPFDSAVDCDIYPNDPICILDPFNSNPSGPGVIPSQPGPGIIPSNPCVAGAGKICDPLGERFGTVPELIKTILEGVIKIGLPIVALAVVFSGFLFVFARGNPEKLTKAKDALLYTLIGAAILLGSWAIAKMIQTTVLSL